jgi:ATP-dependent DNA helicase RecG
LKNTRRGSIIRGLYRQNVAEYPEIAIREAIINAVAHRDYSPLGRSSQIQIKQFPDRLEIISPGGLYGNVALESLVDGQSTRNRILMRFLEDLDLVENRGSGIDAMFDAIKGVGLNPPAFEDKIANFQVTLYNTQQRSDKDKILDYVREHGSIKRAECQILLNIDSRRATYILQAMKNSGVLKQEGTDKSTHYVLS